MNSTIKNLKNRLVLVSPGYNCENIIPIWWNSIKIQNYPNWIVWAIDDASEDRTSSLLWDIHKSDNRLQLIHNSEHKYQLRNWYDVIMNKHCVKDNDIIVFMDMDDWFGSKYVFESIIKEYLYRDIQCTTARNFQLSDYYQHDAALYTDRNQLFQNSDHQFSLFTYRAHLFRSIPKEIFIDDETGDFYKVCGDYCITNPILYQAGPEHHQHQFFNGEPCAIVYNNIRSECDDSTFEKSNEQTRIRIKMANKFYNLYKPIDQ